MHDDAVAVEHKAHARFAIPGQVVHMHIIAHGACASVNTVRDHVIVHSLILISGPGCACMHSGVYAVQLLNRATVQVVHDYTIEHGAYPSPLNYHHFPKSVCTSVNEVICHGIPDVRELQNGDIVNVDVTCYLNGYHGDLNETYLVGEADAESKKLTKVRFACPGPNQ
jgi:hypothetical protein